ncbi:MAG: PAS domain-containing protein, partial [Chloroflexi bacterium]|nr:PAS domain-containing protein [Chloroflexota bacterium]
MVFAAPLIVLASGAPPFEPERRRRLAGAVVVGAIALGLLSFSLHHPIDWAATTWPTTALTALRIGLEVVALVCGAWALARLLGGRASRRDVPLVLIAGVVLIVEQSAAFVVSSSWLLSWWLAHLLGATATIVLTWSVVIGIGDAERRALQLAEQVRIVESAERRANAVLDAAGEAMVMITPQGRVAMANRGFAEMLNRAAADLVDVPVSSLVPDLQRLFGSDDVLTAPTDPIAGNDIVEQIWPRQRAYARFSTVVRGQDGEPLGELFAFRDITHERELDQMKDQFVSLVSHELK